MIQIPNGVISQNATARLAEYQIAIDGNARYEDRVRVAKREFTRRNRRNNPTFREVRQLLTEMCSGARRCMYCEDSVADEVEHYFPKDLYPEHVFRWENYLYACGPCNGPKKSNFTVVAADGTSVDVTRRKSGPIVPPVSGNPLLIAPRTEDPLQYIVLDIVGDTFRFVPHPTNNAQQTARASYTIELLRLNNRDYLPKARREAYRHYVAHLTQYVNKRDAGAAPATTGRITTTIQTMHHPTVWREMKRQQSAISELFDLFQSAPEALMW